MESSIVSFRRLIFMALFIFISVSAIFFSFSNAEFQLPSIKGEKEKEAIPGRKQVVFDANPVLEDMSPENDELWSSTLTTARDGFIWVKHNETFNYQMGISMFHGLHCLKMLRAMLQSKMHQHPDATSSSENDQAETHFLHETHMPHCISYLAQVS